MSIACALVFGSGCYLSHRRPPRPDASAPDAGDAGLDARVDLSFDAGTDGGRPIIPEAGAVTVPCEPDRALLLPSGTPPPPCETRGGDHDRDGFDDAIDCNDCSAQINPGAFDFPGNDVDEDCSGADDLPCDDTGLPVEVGAPPDALRAMGLCQRTTPSDRRWGVLDARFTTADGTGEPADLRQLGVLPELGGFSPVAGSRMLAISTSFARAPMRPSMPVCFDHDVVGGFPPGFPVDAPACPGVVTGEVHDSVALEVRLRAPTNARAFSFASAFYTHEYPDFICSPFNDVFTVLQSRSGGLENIVFDADGNPVTVNTGLLQVCTPGRHGGRRFRCELGATTLLGSGYEIGCDGFAREGAGASTGCIETSSSTEPGAIITLRFAIWDSGDGQLDSLALIDNFQWIPMAFESIAR